MFGNQSNYKSQYEETLRKINCFGTRIQNVIINSIIRLQERLQYILKKNLK